MPVSTDVLAERIEASNDRVTEANNRLTEAIRDLTRKVDEGQKGFSDFKTEVAGELSSVRTSFKWTAWLATIVIGLVTSITSAVAVHQINAATDRAIRSEDRVADLIKSLKIRETTLKKSQGNPGPMPEPEYDNPNSSAVGPPRIYEPD